MLYAFIMENGGDARETTCIGHSLGAHICGMVSNHLDKKQHKIVGKVFFLSNSFNIYQFFVQEIVTFLTILLP